jgi:hypothetical protein
MRVKGCRRKAETEKGGEDFCITKRKRQETREKGQDRERYDQRQTAKTKPNGKDKDKAKRQRQRQRQRQTAKTKTNGKDKGKGKGKDKDKSTCFVITRGGNDVRAWIETSASNPVGVTVEGAAETVRGQRKHLEKGKSKIKGGDTKMKMKRLQKTHLHL